MGRHSSCSSTSSSSEESSKHRKKRSKKDKNKSKRRCRASSSSPSDTSLDSHGGRSSHSNLTHRSSASRRSRTRSKSRDRRHASRQKPNRSKDRRRSKDRDRRGSRDERDKGRRGRDRSRDRARGGGSGERSRDKGRKRAKDKERDKRSRATASKRTACAGEGSLDGGTLGDVLEMVKLTPVERLQLKMRKSLQAASSDITEEHPPIPGLESRLRDDLSKREVTAEDQMRRAAAIEDIESEGFAQQSYSSSRTASNTAADQVSTAAVGVGDAHASAIFGTETASRAALVQASTSLTAQGGKLKVFTKGDNLAGYLWATSLDEKMRRWQHRLSLLRQRKRRI